MKLVHCQIAKQPLPPHEIIAVRDGESLPRIIEDIVLKLMAKKAESRYRSTWGMKTDLEECLRQWESNNSVGKFPLGSQNIPLDFRIP